MKTFLRRFLYFLITPIVLGIGVIAYNIIIDPYGVIRSDMSKQRIEPNQHYLKVKHILNNPKKYDSYLFGSSRVGKIDVRNIKDDYKWYNMSYSQGVPGEHLSELKMFLENNVDIKNIWIGLEETSYLVDKQLHKSQANRKSYVNTWDPLLSYYFLKPSPEIYRQIAEANKATFFTTYDELYKSGVPIPKNVDQWIENNIETHRNLPKFKQPSWNNNEYNERIDLAIKELQEIVSICKKNEINLKLFINPIFVTTYLKQDKEEFFRFLRALSKISDFYDFSGVNKISTDPYFYYEASHYRPMIGDSIIKVLTKAVPIKGVKSFGNLVTQKNIDAVLEEKAHEIETYTGKNTIDD
ncbi:hypothetical protein L0P88_19430 [Muricauda sp. SCSIO 64092]|uniref:hypothetical protein n=1 Tax=Allomuricauda sp. SCSIO 64092 TaxID=2908842 RepID=UPI001FF2C8A7|nr:hypothetical protein [Muricauda sp. SCSIO 64092]UOY06085.1 hypothetical protein L0P88_19430 [Muricauda sp. SCSIO 64092]